jgi:isopenicillin N synthase-like dioxygenase
MPTARIPQLSLSDYANGTAAQRARFIAAFGDGIKEFGFVSFTHHGVDAEVIRRTYADAQAFFALSSEAKHALDVPGGGGQRGYTGYGKEHAKNRSVGDLKEFFHVGRDLPQGHPRAAAYGNNLWPKELTSFKANALALYGALDAAAAVMLQALAEYFKVPLTTFSDMADEGNSILRIIHYPPLKKRFISGGVRAAEHEDINLITLLCESTSSGLEILTRQGDWIPVEALKGQLVVDSGDMLSRVTNEVVPSTTHRVVNPKSADDDVERYSMPFFVHPYPDCSLTVLDACVSPDNPKRYPPITADDFLRQRLKEIGLMK